MRGWNIRLKNKCICIKKIIFISKPNSSKKKKKCIHAIKICEKSGHLPRKLN